MSDGAAHPPGGAPGDEREAGEPIGMLSQLEHEPRASFLESIRRRIYRRTAASHLVSASWHLPGIVFAGLVAMLVYIAGGAGAKKKE